MKNVVRENERGAWGKDVLFKSTSQVTYML